MDLDRYMVNGQWSMVKFVRVSVALGKVDQFVTATNPLPLPACLSVAPPQYINIWIN